MTPVILAAVLMAQSFEVASIKPLETWHPRVVTAVKDPGHVSYPVVSFKWLISAAYDVKRDQIDGPAWMDDRYYDIEAKIPEGASQADIFKMLQNLLADRLALKFHRESKIESAYALIVGKGKLKLAISDGNGAMRFDREGNFQAKGITMAQFARALSTQLHESVIDMTGLAQKFDITLGAEPSIFTSVQELGLKLEHRKLPIEHLVIDHAEMIPTSN